MEKRRCNCGVLELVELSRDSGSCTIGLRLVLATHVCVITRGLYGVSCKKRHYSN